MVGAASGAGKSTVVAALCRALVRRGRSVAPFKAQNMSNHAAVTADGGEIGRAQAMQASAAGLDIDRRMNPILLKPSSDLRSHLVVLGDEVDSADPVGYGAKAERLKPVVLDALTSLREQYPWVVAEGAGGAAEINLLDRDLVNLPLARAAGLPALLVVDIERGGAFAAAHGTIDLLPSELRSTIVGVVFNRFRGDPSLLGSGLVDLEARTGVPVLGVLPWLGPEPLLGVEDALDLVGWTELEDRGERPVRVAVVRFPHLANPSDLDPFLVEPDVTVSWVTGPGRLTDADLVVLPGSRATVSDLAWLRRTGLAAAIGQVAATGSARIIGLCAGYQMLGTSIDDPIESGAGVVAGLDLLPGVTEFRRPKIVRRSRGRAGGHPVSGYQIRFGRPSSLGPAWLEVDAEPEGACSPDGLVTGSSLHGLFDDDEFRAALLSEVAAANGRTYRRPETGFAEALERQHERLADWIGAAIELDRIEELASAAATPDEVPGW